MASAGPTRSSSAGIALGPSGHGEWAPDWLGTFAGAFPIVGSSAGSWPRPTGQALEISWLMWTGYAALPVSVIGFFVIGRLAQSSQPPDEKAIEDPHR